MANYLGNFVITSIIMKNLPNTVINSGMKAKNSLTYDLVQIDSLSIVLSESIQKNKKTNYARVYRKVKP